MVKLNHFESHLENNFFVADMRSYQKNIYKSVINIALKSPIKIAYLRMKQGLDFAKSYLTFNSFNVS